MLYCAVLTCPVWSQRLTSPHCSHLALKSHHVLEVRRFRATCIKRWENILIKSISNRRLMWKRINQQKLWTKSYLRYSKLKNLKIWPKKMYIFIKNSTFSTAHFLGHSEEKGGGSAGCWSLSRSLRVGGSCHSSWSLVTLISEIFPNSWIWTMEYIIIMLSYDPLQTIMFKNIGPYFFFKSNFFFILEIK